MTQNRLLHCFIWEHPSQSRDNILVLFLLVIMIFFIDSLTHVFLNWCYHLFTLVSHVIEVHTLTLKALLNIMNFAWIVSSYPIQQLKHQNKSEDAMHTISLSDPIGWSFDSPNYGVQKAICLKLILKGFV